MPEHPTPRFRCLALFALALEGFVLAILQTTAATAGPEATPRPYEARAAALIEPYLQSGLFSGAILVAKDGKPVLRRAYGLANREWTIPNTPDTQFRLGSITKQFTAAAILQLAERGKLKLDDGIRAFVPDAPESWNGVTLRHLLGHTSGIVNFTALPDYYAKISRIERTPREIVALVEQETLLFEPGTRFEYSNTGYILLGIVIEAVTGQPYPRYLREALLDPLGLKEIDYDDPTLVLPRRASGYRFGQTRWRNAPPMAANVAYAAGELHGTIDGLLAWDEALFGGRVIGRDSLAAMFDDQGRGYGLGWFVGRAHDRRLYSHGGGVSGFLSITDYYPDERLAVIVLANNENAPVQKLSRELGALWLGQAEPLDSIALEDLILDRYAGTYRLGPRFFLTLSRDHGRLLAQGTGQPPIAYFPESDRTFFSPVTDARITIDTEPDGKPNGLVYYQAGRDRVGSRIAPDEAARILAEPKPEHREIPIDPACLPALVGRYALAPGQTLAVTRDENRLYAQITGQPRLPLFAEGPRRFFLKSVDAQITFEGEGHQPASGLILHQNGLDTPAPRIEPGKTTARKRVGEHGTRP